MLLGICATLALPPVYALPLLVPSFAGLFLLAHSAVSRRQAFWDGWWWGLGHFTAGLYWICISLYVDPAQFAWLTPFALFGLPAVLGIYTGLVTFLVKWAEPRIKRRECQILLFAALWVFVEYLRSHLFTGFPWNLIGYAWTMSDVTLQLASVIGVYGLSWLAVLCATLPALFALQERAPAWRINRANIALLVFIVAFGALRLANHPTDYTNVKIRIVQGNIQESMKWDPKAVLDGLKKYALLTRSPGIQNVNLVVWPETAVPYFISADTALVHDLGSLIAPDALLLTGGLRGDGDEKHWQAWNSLFAIDRKGQIVAQYDKHHLVPFGEYIPMRHILPLENIAGGIGDFSRGPGPETLKAGLYPPFSPLICYEAVFPGEATDGAGRAKWVLNVTNDAWFGISSGPYQHLEMARIRAVEQGIPLVRAANTGISAGFDAYGRLISNLSLEKEGILDLYLPHEAKPEAIFSRCPYATILFMIALSALFIILAHKKRHKYK